MKWGWLLAVAILLAFPAEGADLMVFGTGNTSCGVWSQGHSDGRKDALAISQESWVFGYVTAMNSVSLLSGGRDLGASVDGPGMIGWISNYCAANPLETIYKAADMLVGELARRSAR